MTMPPPLDGVAAVPAPVAWLPVTVEYFAVRPVVVTKPPPYTMPFGACALFPDTMLSTSRESMTANAAPAAADAPGGSTPTSVVATFPESTLAYATRLPYAIRPPPTDRDCPCAVHPVTVVLFSVTLPWEKMQPP